MEDPSTVQSYLFTYAHRSRWSIGHLRPLAIALCSGAGIMEAGDRQATTVFTVQPSFQHRHSTHRVSRSVAIVGKRRGDEVTARSLTMVTLHDTRFVECRWWNDGWTVKTVVTRRSPASMIPAPGLLWPFQTSWFLAVEVSKMETLPCTHTRSMLL